MIAATIVATAWFAMAAPAQAVAPAPAPDVIASIQVHGNNVTPDTDILVLAAIAVGDPFGPTTGADVRRRLIASGKFEGVEVLKRYASIADPSRISLVILVNERPVSIQPGPVAGGPVTLVRRGPLRNLLFLPILNAEDGYGVTYGARLAYVDMPGKGSRFSFPLSWGGSKEAGAEFEQALAKGPITRLRGGVAAEQRHNPAFDRDDDRRRVWMRAERAAGPVRAGAMVGWERVAFADETAALRSIGADVTVDTRLDPALPRNAVYARAAWTRVYIDGAPVDRREIDVRGYLGLIGQAVMVGRLAREDASRSLPDYLKPLVGGWSSLRGFKAGAFAGDTAVLGSAELRLPLSSPLQVVRMGISIFVDAGSAYDVGQRLADQSMHVGTGVGAWMAATVFRLGVSVAHGRHGDTRLNFGVGLGF